MTWLHSSRTLPPSLRHCHLVARISPFDRRRWAPVALAVAALAWPTSGHAADQALLVGINQYPGLNGANLDGSVNDATSMAAALGKYHFETTLLTDGKATKQAILNALDAMKSKVKPTDRFVFYYAGHGTRTANGDAVLLPGDASQNTDAFDLTADALYQRINAIPAVSRTAIMDSCFSGGMSRALNSKLGLKRKFKTRYYERKRLGTRSKDLIEVNAADSVENLDKGTGRVCYFTATKKNERAAEYEAEEGPEKGKPHGVFTVSILDYLNGDKEKWGNLHNEVSGKVVEGTDDLQHPTLSQPYVDVLMFESKDASPSPTPPTPNPKPSTLFDLYNRENRNTDQIQVTMTPNLTPVSVKAKFKFQVKVGATGALVMMERGTSGRINLLFPRSGKADDAAVTAGQTLFIPTKDPVTSEQKAYVADTAGTERVKAFLFAQPEQAEEVLRQFGVGVNAGLGLTFAMAKTRDLVEVSDPAPEPGPQPKPSPQADVYTSEIQFEVVEAGSHSPN